LRSRSSLNAATRIRKLAIISIAELLASFSVRGAIVVADVLTAVTAVGLAAVVAADVVVGATALDTVVMLACGSSTAIGVDVFVVAVLGDVAAITGALVVAVILPLVTTPAAAVIVGAAAVLVRVVAAALAVRRVRSQPITSSARSTVSRRCSYDDCAHCHTRSIIHAHTTSRTDAHAHTNVRLVAVRCARAS
jgi:hypothetical protein